MLGVLIALGLGPVLLSHVGPDKVQIVEVAPGTGDAVAAFDYVSVEYTGKLRDGKVFDSSVGKDPISFVIGTSQVIPGWEQGILGMKVGGRRTLTIPPSLGYGKAGSPPVIPGNATLIFDVTLKKIEHSTIETTQEGTGEKANPGDTVELNYTGKFPDGKQFDSSLDKGRTPILVQIGRPNMIPGFIQGLLGVKLGEKRKITMAPSLAYGVRGRPPIIPPNSTLVFEIEILRILPQTKKKS